MAIDRISNIVQRKSGVTTQALHSLIYNGSTTENGCKLRKLIGQNKKQGPEDVVDLSEKIIKKAGTGHSDSDLSPKLQPMSVLEESATMKALYSPKYKIPQGINEDGYYITTVIDKKSKKPVTAYVRQEENFANGETWTISIKNSNGDYEEIGSRNINIDPSGNLHPCVMLMSSDKNQIYSGVGLRLHQIAIERMLQSKGESISIYAVRHSFPFHYKCGFRVNPKQDGKFPDEGIDTVINRYSTKFDISKEKLKSMLIKRKFKGVEGYGVNETYQEWAKFLYLRNKEIGLESILMELPPGAIQAWKARINTQPILQASY